MGYKDSQLEGYKKKHRQPLDDILREEDMTILLGCSIETLWLYRRDLGLPYIKIGRDVYYSQKSVYKWFQSLERVNNNHKGGGDEH